MLRSDEDPAQTTVDLGPAKEASQSELHRPGHARFPPPQQLPQQQTLQPTD